ncbi:MAG: hypothetical protein AB1469_05960 [Pseudomonadota bacterium]
MLLRPSGTEPLVRVMVDGRDQRQVEAGGCTLQVHHAWRVGRPHEGSGSQRHFLGR